MVDWGELVVDADETFEEGPVRIMDSREQVLPGKTVRLVKVLLQNQVVEEVTWERDDTIHANYPCLFEEEDQILPKQWELLAGTWIIQASYTGKRSNGSSDICGVLRAKALCFKGGDTILTGC